MGQAPPETPPGTASQEPAKPSLDFEYGTITHEGLMIVAHESEVHLMYNHQSEEDHGKSRSVVRTQEHRSVQAA